MKRSTLTILAFVLALGPVLILALLAYLSRNPNRKRK